MTQLGERDDELNADLFSVSLDPYNKMLDAFTFSVSASGVQSDSRISDPEFNAVWESATAVVEDGWMVEMKIPYYAIRFPKGEKQDWKVQFSREIRRSRTEVQWSLVPKNTETPLNYWGTLKGLNRRISTLGWSSRAVNFVTSPSNCTSSRRTRTRTPLSAAANR